MMSERASPKPGVLRTLQLQRLSTRMSIFIAVLGTLVIVGWFFDIPILQSVLPGLPTMKFNTALLFVLLGLAAVSTDTRPRFSQFCAVVVIVIAVLTLAEYAFGWNAGIDEWLIRDNATRLIGGNFPGRMSVITAIDFACLGMSLLTLKRQQVAAQIFVLLALALAFLAFTGYIYNSDSLASIFAFSTMALHTAVAFIVSALSILFIQTDTWLIQMVFNDRTSGIIIRKLLPVAVFVPLLVGWLRLQGQAAGLFPIEFGSALTAIVHIGIFLGVVAWMAFYLDRIDRERMNAEAEQKRILDDLERRVEERTAELTQANKTLIASEQRFRLLVNNVRDYAIYMLDLQGKVASWNEGATRIKGYQADEIVGQHFSCFYTIEDREQGVPQHLLKTAEHEGQGASEGWRVHKDGTQFWARVVISAVCDETSHLIGFAAVTQNLTESKRAEQALKESETRFRAMAELLPVPMQVSSVSKGEVLYANPAFGDLVGFTPDELVGRKSIEFYDKPEDRAAVIAKLKQDGFLRNFEFRGRRPTDRQPFWAYISSQFITFDNELALMGVFVDVTEQKRLEEVVKQSEALLRHVLEILPVGLWITDAQGKITQGNPAGSQIWAGIKYVGIDQYGEYKGWRVDTGAPIEPQDWAAARAVIKGETSINEEVEIECFDKTHKYILNSAIPLLDDKKQVLGAIVVNQDVTVIKQAELQLKRYADALEHSNQELEAFVYTASHDLQEPLWKIQAFGERLIAIDGDKLSTKGKDYLDRMTSASTRMRNLIDDLLSYSRVTTRKKAFIPVDLNQVVKFVLNDLELTIEKLDVSIEVDPLPVIDADDTQMRQLFQNLITNAIKFHAPDRSPFIQIKGRSLLHEAHNDSIDNHLALKYEIEVLDNGIGFDPKYAERIFGMFERLHGRNQFEGTGIGLAICQKVVLRHGGTIVARGEKGVGASFVVTLPVRQTPEGNLKS